MEQATQKYHTHLKAKNGWFDINLKELWQYRDLIWLFTKRRFILVYKQTILGPAWIVLQPLMTTLIYTLVFGNIANISTDGIPQILFYMGGTAVWTFFSTCLNQTSATFTGNSRIFGKVYFPRLVSPISTVLSSAINFLVHFAMFLIFWVYFVVTGAITPHYIYIILLPFIMLYLGLLSLGFGIIVSSLTTKYRDLAMLVTFGVQLWMYITPVVYPISTLEGSVFYNLIMLNPVTCVVETFRWMFLGVGDVNPIYWMISLIVMTVVVTLGVILFSKVEKTFMDTV